MKIHREVKKLADRYFQAQILRLGPIVSSPIINAPQQLVKATAKRGRPARKAA